MMPEAISPESLKRFQEARSLARIKMTGEDARTNLQRLLSAKRAGQDGSSAKLPHIASSPKTDKIKGQKALSLGNTLLKANELLLYSREKTTTKTVPNKRVLGNYIDMVA